jgi:hypothetical protein
MVARRIALFALTVVASTAPAHADPLLRRERLGAELFVYVDPQTGVPEPEVLFPSAHGASVIVADPFYCVPDSRGYASGAAFERHLADDHELAPADVRELAIRRGGRVLYYGRDPRVAERLPQIRARERR